MVSCVSVKIKYTNVGEKNQYILYIHYTWIVERANKSFSVDKRTLYRRKNPVSIPRRENRKCKHNRNAVCEHNKYWYITI